MPLRRVTPPGAPRRDVIACVVGRIEQARIDSALAHEGALQRCASVAELRRLVAAAGDSLRMIVVEPRDAAGCSTAPVVRDVRLRRPGVTIVAYCRADPDHSRDIIELAAAGIHELIFRDSTDAGHMLRRTLASATQSCGAAQAAERLAALVPRFMRPLVDYALYFPNLSTSVPRVAAALGVHRKTLANYCVRAGLPGPATVIVWCRLTIAAHLLETQDTSVDRIAIELEFPSGTALRNTFRRYTGLRPAQLRDGGMQRVLDAFAGALSHGPSVHPTMSQRAS